MSSVVDNLRGGSRLSPGLGLTTDPVRVAARRGQASVVVPLFLGRDRPEEDESLRVILTQRAFTLKSHPGETAFPGGKLDAGETVLEAAFRECHEEIGIDLHDMVRNDTAEVLTVLDPLISKHLLSVTAVVVFLKHVRKLSDLELQVNQDEVAAVYTAPLELFLGTDGYEYADVDVVVEDSTHNVRVHSWMFSTEEAHPPSTEPFRIWGLTGWILVHVAMMGYKQAANFDLRGVSNVGLGDFVPS